MKTSTVMRQSGRFRVRNRRKPQNRKLYEFTAKFAPISGTDRHCYIHPAEPAVAWELNAHDASYKRPVCEGCAS